MRGPELEGASGSPPRTPRTWRTSLVADADIAIGRLLGRGLPSEGFDVEVEYTGKDVLRRVAEHCPDTVVLGSDLPDMTTIELIGRLGSGMGPSLLVLLDAYNANIVQVLNAGAGDCMRKPVLVGELAARLRKLVRRRLQSQGVPASIKTETMELDCVLWRATVRGVEVQLSVREQAALRMLVEDVGNVVSNGDFLARLWGSPDLPHAGRIGTVIRSLRSKLDLKLDGAARLLAVPQVGYRLVVPGYPVYGERRKPE